jgi:hypothetical protein
MFANFGGVGMATMIGGQVAGQFVGQLDHRIASTPSCNTKPSQVSRLPLVWPALLLAFVP